MKPFKSIFFIILCVCSLHTAAQTDSEYAALGEFITSDVLNDLMENNEMRYKQMAVINKRGYYVISAGEKNILQYPSIQEISKRYQSLPDLTPALAESGDLNLIGYDIQLSKTDYTYYRLGESNNLLVIPPVELTLKRANLEIH